MKNKFIEFKNVYKKFGENHVLNGVSFSIFKGEITSIIGKSGVGKSVLLKHVIGLFWQDSGEILFYGKLINQLKKSEKKEFKKKISYMFQNNALFDSMTIFENIALPLKETKHISDKKTKEKVLQKMEQLDLKDIESKYPSQISGGMQKRVALARALITDPEVVLFDEPTTGLDPVRKNTVQNMISDYQRQFGFTGIIVTHDIPDIFKISQKIIMIDDGKVIFEGSAGEIKISKNAVVKQFINGVNYK